jgi:hypothetical protein
MDLHFCSRCGISIPQSEIDAGAAAGAGGKYFCSEHRGGSAVAVAESPRGAGSAFGDAAPGEEPELLFCANCRVSIPQDDSRSGRAHREFGSLLCAGCSKADPGERAARREAVEAEMAADVDAQDPVVARRCSVCSAAVPYGQIVTGKAKVEGNRVVCERCRAATASATGDAKPAAMSPGLVLAIVVVLMGALGFFGMRAWKDQQKTTQNNDSLQEQKNLRSDMDLKFQAYNARLDDAIRRASEPDKDAVKERERAEAEAMNLRQALADLRAEKAKSEADLAQRATKLEVEVEALKDRIRDLAGRPAAVAPTAPPPEEKRPDVQPPGPAAGPPPGPGPAPGNGPKVEAVDPEIAKLCKELLESPDDGIRFAAARELTTRKSPASVPSLVKALADDKHYFVRRVCARALGVIKAWLAVPALIRALEDREVYVALAANIALQNITGYDAGVTQDSSAGQRKTKAQAADKWWDKNKDHPPDGVSLHPINE